MARAGAIWIPVLQFTEPRKSELGLKLKTGDILMANKWILDEMKCLLKSEISRLRLTMKARMNTDEEGIPLHVLNDWFLIELGLNTGMRVQEMADCAYRDFFVAGQNTMIIHGKGSKERTIRIPGDLSHSIKHFIAAKKVRGFCTCGNEPVFKNTRTLTKFTTRGLQKAFKRCIKLAHLPPHYSVHCLRHTYASFLLHASGRNFELVQRSLGHASIITTQVYSHILPGETEKALKKLYS